MRLHNNYPNEVLIDMAGLLAYNNDKVEEVAKWEVLQEDVTDLALNLSNYYLNNYEMNDEISPLQNQRDYFNTKGQEIIREYFEGNDIEDILEDKTYECNANAGGCLTVGDIRMSNYGDTTPIMSRSNSGDSCFRTSRYSCEVFVDSKELNDPQFYPEVEISIESEGSRLRKAIIFA